MILILSEEGDITTNDVMDWLAYYSVPFIRVNEEDQIIIENFSLTRSGKLDFVLRVQNFSVQFGALTGFFYRRGFFRFNIYVPKSNDKEIYEALRNHIRQDAVDINEFIAFMLELSVPHIGEFRLRRLNKLIVLKTATECGLMIPPSFLSESLAQVEAILKMEKSLITKGVSDTFSSESFELGVNIACYTARISLEDIQTCDIAIAPTLFQTEINKLFEIRSFYLNGFFYSMAIISQINSKTQIDYRQYDSEYPNRNVPFQLPSEIEQKLDKLMKRLSLSTGSIDLIVDIDGNYFFLEVNPVGQFGALSETCNYKLERKIANFFHATNRRSES